MMNAAVLFLYRIYMTFVLTADNSFDELREVFSRYDPRIWIVSFAVIGIYIFEGILLAKGYFRFKTKNAKRVEKAESLGHVVTAVMIGHEDYYSPDDPNPLRAANYHYAVGGEKYKYRYVGHDEPTRTLTLYYLNNPKKAFVRTSTYVNLSLITAFLPLIIGAALVYFLGIDVG